MAVPPHRRRRRLQPGKRFPSQLFSLRPSCQNFLRFQERLRQNIHFGRTVRAHDRVHPAGVHREVDALQYFLVVDLDVQIFDFKQWHSMSRKLGRTQNLHAHPTEPSSETEISFCASTANSIGNCCSTSLTKPLTTSAVASSAESPRCRQ